MSSTNEYGSQDHKTRAVEWFAKLRDDLCFALELAEADAEGPN